MTPYRSASFAGYAIGSARSIISLPVDTAGVALASAAAGLGWAFGSANVTLLWVVGLAMLMDLIVGSMRAATDPLQDFSTAKLYGGFLGKLFRALFIPTASLVDWLIIASPMPLPDGYEQAFPATALAMIGLAAAEITSTLSKFRDGGISPGLISAVIRHLDKLKVGQEPPARRHYDAPAISEEEERKKGGER